jgi:hypothetical protein
MTILRAYQVAGRPAVKMRPMGSYEAWSAVVRAPLIWLGLADPAETQDALRESADTEHETIRTLLRAWHTTYNERAVTVRTVLADTAGSDLPETRAALRDAISAHVDVPAGAMPTARKLGNRLRALRGKRSGSYIFERATEHTEDGAAWRVRTVRAPDSADDTDSNSNPSRERGKPVEKFKTEEGSRKQSQNSHHSQPVAPRKTPEPSNPEEWRVT